MVWESKSDIWQNDEFVFVKFTRLIEMADLKFAQMRPFGHCYKAIGHMKATACESLNHLYLVAINESRFHVK